MRTRDDRCLHSCSFRVSNVEPTDGRSGVLRAGLPVRRPCTARAQRVLVSMYRLVVVGMALHRLDVSDAILDNMKTT